LRRTCISILLTPWVVLRAISRKTRDDKILTGPADHCRNNYDAPGALPEAAAFYDFYYAAAINPDGRHDKILASRLSDTPGISWKFLRDAPGVVLLAAKSSSSQTRPQGQPAHQAAVAVL
jgi:hypothetical protein